MNQIFTDDQVNTLKVEALETVKAGTDVIQFAAAKIMENPIKTALTMGLFAIAVGSVKVKLSDLVDIKK